MKNTYILNKTAFQKFIEECNYDIEELSDRLILSSTTILSNYKLVSENKNDGVFIPKSTHTINEKTAAKFEKLGMHDCYLDVNKLLFIMSVTGEKPFSTQEKIVLSCMIFGFPDTLLWNGKMIRESVAKYKELNPTRVSETLNVSDLFDYVVSEEKFQLNIGNIINRIIK